MIRRLLAAVSACVLASVVLASTTQAQEAPQSGPPAAAAEASLFELLNESRVAEGLVPLMLRDGLSRLAREWSTTLSSTGELSHNPNLLEDIQSALSERVRSVAENVRHGADLESLHDAFLSSPPHRRALLGDYDLVGIGVVQAASRTWVTFDFAEVTNHGTPQGQGPPLDADDDVDAGNQPPPEVAGGAPPGAQDPPTTEATPSPAEDETAPAPQEEPPAPAPEAAAAPAPEERSPPPSEEEPVITPEPALQARATSKAVRARPPSSASGSSSANPLELAGMEGLLAFGPDQLDDLTGPAAGADEDEGDQVQTTAAQGSSRPLDAFSGDPAGEQALQAGAAPEDTSGGLGVLQVLTLAVLGLAAAVATSIALRPRRRTATRARSKADASPVRHERPTPRVLSFAAASPAPTNHRLAPHDDGTEVPMPAPPPPPPLTTASDASRPHIPDVDMPRTATPRSEAPSPGLPRSESPRPEGPRPAAPPPEVPRPEATRPDVAYPPIGSTRNEARHATRPVRSIAEVAGELGVDEVTLGEWVRAERTKTSALVPPLLVDVQPPSTDAQLQQENERLKRRIAELEADRDLLKRTTAFWVNESNG